MKGCCVLLSSLDCPRDWAVVCLFRLPGGLLRLLVAIECEVVLVPWGLGMTKSLVLF